MRTSAIALLAREPSCSLASGAYNRSGLVSGCAAEAATSSRLYIFSDSQLMAFVDASFCGQALSHLPGFFRFRPTEKPNLFIWKERGLFRFGCECAVPRRAWAYVSAATNQSIPL